MLSGETIELLNAQYKAQRYWELLYQHNKYYPHDKERQQQTRQAQSTAYQLAVEAIQALQNEPGFDPAILDLWYEYNGEHV